ncbi:hypothetical protein, partial [Citrobacter sp. Cf140]|uniref:hypothetical protein n=1 Tax=Citrobacter sp. Cf140 TaxID=2985083 RepID=UPI0025786336
DSVHHIWCPLSSQEFQDLPDGAETTLTVIAVVAYLGMFIWYFRRMQQINAARFVCDPSVNFEVVK